MIFNIWESPQWPSRRLRISMEHIVIFFCSWQAREMSMNPTGADQAEFPEKVSSSKNRRIQNWGKAAILHLFQKMTFWADYIEKKCWKEELEYIMYIYILYYYYITIYIWFWLVISILGIWNYVRFFNHLQNPYEATKFHRGLRWWRWSWIITSHKRKLQKTKNEFHGGV